MKTAICPQNTFVLRTPRLPVSEFAALGDNPQQTLAHLQQWLKQPYVQETLYLASPSLADRAGLLLTEQFLTERMNSETLNKDKAKSLAKLQQTLLKYFIRMTNRPTPFGLFSGITSGQVTDVSQMQSAGLPSDRRKTRLDISYLAKLKQHCLSTLKRSDALRYYPNKSHYSVGEQCRYIESYQSADSRQYRLSVIDIDEAFSTMLELAKDGLNFNQLIGAFNTRFADVDENEVADYLEQLIDEGILVGDIPLPLTGGSPDEALVDALHHIEQGDSAETLKQAIALLQQHDLQGQPQTEIYRQVIALLKTLEVEVNTAQLFQTDVYRTFNRCTLASTSLAKLTKQLALLASAQSTPNNPFESFVQSFNRRFEGQFVPLQQVLDEESGIGFSKETGYEAPLLAELQFARANLSNGTSATTSAMDAFIIEHLSHPQNRALDVIQLSSKSLAAHLGKTLDESRFPASFAAQVNLYEDSQGQLLMKFNGCYGPSAANYLGRFCHLDEPMKNAVVEMLEAEQHHSPDVIFAEIVHMPEGRPGNVIARPHLRDYEIVFMADSTRPGEYQITLDDLYVWVENREVKLWSKRLNKQIIPRLSCAHNYSSRSLSAYKFLSMLQHQSTVLPQFKLPGLLAETRFVPRIVLDDLILSEKIWRIDRSQLASLLSDGQVDNAKWQAFKQQYQLDDIVCYSHADLVLTFNLTNPLMLKALLDETKGRQRLTLKEALHHQMATPVKSIDGQSFANEAIIPFFNQKAKVHRHYVDEPLKSILTKQTKRHFAPGSQWLSLKIYGGNSTLDNLLWEKLMPFIKQNGKLFSQWFFIRYGDPDWHLRVRFQGSPETLWGKLLPKINTLLSPMIDSGELNALEVFTYIRETERYGGDRAMALAESLFMADSHLVCRLIELADDYQDATLLARGAVKMIDLMLIELDFSHQDKLAFIGELRTAFGKEFAETAALRKQMGLKYQALKTAIAQDLNGNTFDGLTQKLSELLIQWQQQATPTLRALKSLINQTDGITCHPNKLLGSLSHMHINRLFKAYGREHELLIYDLLRRHYFSHGKQR